MTAEPADPLDGLFVGLEDQYFEQGFQQGLADGSKQSRISARLFGMEQGFDKWAVMGQLHARALIWAARLRRPSRESSLPALPANERVAKHLETLLALVDPRTLSLENTDDAVSDFDDRLKRAQAKVKVIQRILGPDPLFPAEQEPKTAGSGQRSTAAANMEDFGL